MLQYLYIEAAQTALDLHEIAVEQAALEQAERERRVKEAQEQVAREVETAG